jgi:hypothetical protein
MRKNIWIARSIVWAALAGAIACSSTPDRGSREERAADSPLPLTEDLAVPLKAESYRVTRSTPTEGELVTYRGRDSAVDAVEWSYREDGQHYRVRSDGHTYVFYLAPPGKADKLLIDGAVVSLGANAQPPSDGERSVIEELGAAVTLVGRVSVPGAQPPGASQGPQPDATCGNCVDKIGDPGMLQSGVTINGPAAHCTFRVLPNCISESVICGEALNNLTSACIAATGQVCTSVSACNVHPLIFKGVPIYTEAYYTGTLQTCNLSACPQTPKPCGAPCLYNSQCFSGSCTNINSSGVGSCSGSTSTCSTSCADSCGNTGPCNGYGCFSTCGGDPMTGSCSYGACESSCVVGTSCDPDQCLYGECCGESCCE